MDFVERWFHVSPDVGNGSLEILYFVAVLILIVLLLCRRRLAALPARAIKRGR